MSRVYITKSVEIDSAHSLGFPSCSKEENAELFGKCSRIHGHRWLIEVTVSAEGANLRNGMVMNFLDLKKILEEVIVNKCDHQYLNNLLMFKRNLPTAEIMCCVFREELEKVLKERHPKVQLEKVMVSETPTSKAFVTKER